MICFERSDRAPAPGCAIGGSGDRSDMDYCVQPVVVPDSPFIGHLEDMKCAYIMDDVTIRQAVKMYLSTPNFAILIYSYPKYWDTTHVTNMNQLLTDL